MSLGLENGTIFAGRYKVLGCIGSGGMGAVYEVLHLETERRRALKIMLPQMLRSHELRQRFKREARVGGRVESEFIVDVFDAGVDEATGLPFLVMELLRGEELGKRLARAGRLPPTEAVAYLQQTALALDKTHRASIIHRDLKPENLFLTEREEGRPKIKVLDFGVAKLLRDSITGSRGNPFVGTPLYMSPEQFNPELPLTPATDIYSLGMIAYTLLVGTAYWEDEGETCGSLIAFAMLVVKGPKELATVRAARRGVRLPAAFDPWFSQASAADPTRRFQKATAAVSSLAEALGLVVTHGSSPPEQVEVIPSGPALALATAKTGKAEPALRQPVQTSSLAGAASTKQWGDQRMVPIVAGAMVIGGIILASALYFWWRGPAVRENGAAGVSSSRDVGMTGPAAAPIGNPVPPVAPLLPMTQPTAAPEPPASSTAAEPNESAAAPEPTPKPRPSEKPAPLPRKPPNHPDYSQD